MERHPQIADPMCRARGEIQEACDNVHTYLDVNRFIELAKALERDMYREIERAHARVRKEKTGDLAAHLTEMGLGDIVDRYFPPQ